MAAYVEHANRMSAPQDDVGDLARVLGGLRWRLGLEQILAFGVRGYIASALALIGLALAAWLIPIANWTELAWVVALPLAAAIMLALIRWPSERQAALAADRRLALAERLATAVELVNRLGSERGVTGRFDRLQVREAVARARGTRHDWLLLDRTVRREALLGASLSLLAGAALILPGLPRPGLAVSGLTPAMVAVSPPADIEERSRSIPQETTTLTASEPQPAQQVAADADLATRVQQEQTERAALDSLARAMGQISAGQAAADALQRGDFATARDQLSTLGEEADQLSDAAKQQLSSALQQAASATAATDKALADRERQAAQALGRNNYADQRQALRNLADQVQKSGARAASADQLARDVGRLQQQAGGSQTGANSSSSANSSNPSSSTGAASAAGQAAASSAGGDGQQGGSGAGSGASPNSLGDQSSRLDTAGQRVEVPTKLGTGPGVRPPSGTEDQTGIDPSATTRSVSELVQSQQTGQVAPEQNLVQGEHRPIIRGYFR